MARSPAVAGLFYPDTQDELVNAVEACFAHDLGPGSPPEEGGSERALRGLVCPHAGYAFSGPVAAHAFKRLAEDGLPGTVVVVGPNHRGAGAGVALGTEPFDTPLGTVEIDEEIVSALLSAEETAEIVERDDRAHRREHSLEVQLPFVQYLAGLYSREVKMVPICCRRQNLEVAKQLGSSIREAAQDKDVVVIASSDFSHYVPKATAERQDRIALDAIERNDPEGLFRAVEQHGITMCGYGPVAAMMVACEGRRGELLKYATSGDVVSHRDVVGYAALAF